MREIEKERNYVVKNCIREYYDRDMEILLDSSITKVIASIYCIYNLIYFGNKILIPQRIFEELNDFACREAYHKEEEIMVHNSKFLLAAIEKDTRNNYIILESTGNNKEEDFVNILNSRENCIAYVNDSIFMEKLKAKGVGEKIFYYAKGREVTSPFNNKSCKFETIGAIRFNEDGSMWIEQKNNVLIKIYDKNGVEKLEEKKFVKERDFVLIRGENEERYSFNLYQVVSCHTRNHAVRIIWSDLKKGERSNKYIDRLPYKYKEMISRNIY